MVTRIRAEQITSTTNLSGTSMLADGFSNVDWDYRGHIIQYDGMTQEPRENLNFVGDSFVVYENIALRQTIISGTSSGIQGEQGPPGSPGSNTLLIHDDNVFKVTGSSISFNDGLDVAVTGSVAFVNSDYKVKVDASDVSPSYLIDALKEGPGISIDLAQGTEQVIISYTGTSGGGSGSATSFLELSDTPDSYSGYGTYRLRVNTGSSAIEFVQTINVAYLTFNTGTTTTGQDTNRTTGGTYASHGAWINIFRPIKLNKIYWDIANTGTYTLTITGLGSSPSTFYTFSSVYVTAAGSADVVFTPPNPPVLIMPGSYYFKLTRSEGATTWSDNTTDGGSVSVAFDFWWSWVSWYATTADNGFSPAIKLEAYLGSYALDNI